MPTKTSQVWKLHFEKILNLKGPQEEGFQINISSGAGTVGNLVTMSLDSTAVGTREVSYPFKTAEKQALLVYMLREMARVAGEAAVYLEGLKGVGK